MAIDERTIDPRSSVSRVLEEFNQFTGDLRELHEKLQRLDQLVKEGKIAKPVADSLRSEYLATLMNSAEEYFRRKDELESAKARVIVEVERLKADMEVSRGGRPPGVADSERLRRVDAQIHQLNSLLDSIDDALEALDLETKLFLVQRYFLSSREALKKGEITEETLEERRLVCKKFLDSVLEDWAVEKRDLVNQISELDASIISLQSRLKELWVRFMVKEYDKGYYNMKRVELEGELSKSERKTSELRAIVDKNDSRIFEVSHMISEA